MELLLQTAVVFSSWVSDEERRVGGQTEACGGGRERTLFSSRGPSHAPTALWSGRIWTHGTKDEVIIAQPSKTRELEIKNGQRI